MEINGVAHIVEGESVRGVRDVLRRSHALARVGGWSFGPMSSSITWRSDGPRDPAVGTGTLGSRSRRPGAWIDHLSGLGTSLTVVMVRQMKTLSDRSVPAYYRHMDAGVNELVLEIKRVVPVPRVTVFAAFTDPSELVKWWGPEGFTIPRLEFQARVGATYRIQMQPPEGDAFSLQGEFQTVEVPNLLAYTFAWEEPDPDDVATLVDLSFRDLGQSTEIALRQGPFKTESRRALHREGWTDSFNKLERLLFSEA